MKQLFLPLAALLFPGSLLFAQKSPAPPSVKERTQNITIRKKGSDKEKTTIVIDGDKITVNGKPLGDYKGDIRITENNGQDFEVTASLPPLPPVALRGGVKSFSNDVFLDQNDAFLGVFTEDDDNGAKVSSVAKNSAAEKSGLKAGDVITKINNDKIDDADDLIEAVGKYKPEDKVTITYLRDKKENSITATLEKNKQNDFAYRFGNKDFANHFKNFSWNSDDSRQRLGIHVEDVETGSGVKITDINDDESPAAKAGLKEEDVITQINGKAVASVADAKEKLAGLQPGDDVTVTYQRKGIAQTATIHMPKTLESSDL